MTSSGRIARRRASGWRVGSDAHHRLAPQLDDLDAGVDERRPDERDVDHVLAQRDGVERRRAHVELEVHARMLRAEGARRSRRPVRP